MNMRKFETYDAICSQPDAIREVITRSTVDATLIAKDIELSGRIFIVGIGSSFHAAQLGAYVLNDVLPKRNAFPLCSSEFVDYTPFLLSTDFVIAISHRGNKLYTCKSIEIAKGHGCKVVLITGKNSSADVSRLDYLLITVAQEKSSAHTVSYMCSVVCLYLIAAMLKDSQGQLVGELRAQLRTLAPKSISDAIKSEEVVKETAQRVRESRRIWLVGGGPNAVTANEIALKVKETSYLQAEAVSTEAMLHGSFQCVEKDDCFILIAPFDVSQRRTMELVGLAEIVGAYVILVGDSSVTSFSKDHTKFIVDLLHHSITSLACTVPLQLLAYHLALCKGTNPDNFRLDDPRFAKARSLVQL